MFNKLPGKLLLILVLSLTLTGVLGILYVYKSKSPNYSVSSPSQIQSGLPVYPNATFEKSENLHFVWVTEDSVVDVMRWYLAELPKIGWTITEPPDDPKAQGEQVAKISKPNLSGYVAVESEGGVSNEIVIDLDYVK